MSTVFTDILVTMTPETQKALRSAIPKEFVVPIMEAEYAKTAQAYLDLDPTTDAGLDEIRNAHRDLAILRDLDPLEQTLVRLVLRHRGPRRV